MLQNMINAKFFSQKIYTFDTKYIQSNEIENIHLKYRVSGLPFIRHKILKFSIFVGLRSIRRNSYDGNYIVEYSSRSHI